MQNILLAELLNLMMGHGDMGFQHMAEYESRLVGWLVGWLVSCF